MKPQALLDQTKTQEQALEIQRAQLQHALAVLLGRAVEGFPCLILGLPANLLDRRPDIAEAHRYIAAATAQIGVAKGGLLPAIFSDRRGRIREH